MKRVFLLVLDSFGVGYSFDADKFNDVGANTFGHIAEHCYFGRANYNRLGNLNIPNLISLGLGNIYYKIKGHFPLGIMSPKKIIGSYGYASEISTAKDTSSGHWEMTGIPVLFQWDYFPCQKNSFPQKILDQIILQFRLPGILGNCHASGIEVLKNFGKQHIQTKQPIFYTSADSVLQVACHEKYFGLNNLYKLCYGIRSILDQYNLNITRVIARPFLGDNQSDFIRTGNRKDFSKPPHAITVLQKLIEEKNGYVIALGKISDIFANIGITKSIHAVGLRDLIDKTIHQIKISLDYTMVFVNFVDFDSIWGHRRDVSGYAHGLELFDRQLPKILHALHDEDILIITADHGCDPTFPGTDHTREYVPILLYNKLLRSSDIGYRKTFSDIAQTIAQYFLLSSMKYGVSIL
ncbi:phosphopentomutase [Buchnera aphidicola]|uniref:Phosphopentomutase n=1 Tax=Buchnera aphidicola (Sarucallis kahawaluokalani) TaxID=1241878 RepID=A0A4D6Y8Z2_9GAMM|nr:phosphopentomutase [Buchnera aphidicola]QCI26147.1 phosphopentomutase [Buchnera aphidicola (Sarucallis kahawaluokalani)]